MKKIIRTIILLIVAFIVLTFVISFFVINNGSFLTRFNFKSVTNIGLNYYVYFDKVLSSDHYELIVYNSDNIIIKKESTKSNSIEIHFDSLKYNESYKMIVIAYDKDGNKKSVEKPYIFVWDELDFSNNNIVLMDNESDYTIDFIGDYKNKDYKLNIYKDNKLEETVDIKSDSYTIENKKFKDDKCIYKYEIVYNSVILSKYYSYNLMSPITDILITSPNNGDILDYNDVVLSFDGGDNASNYLFELYRNDKLIRRKEIKEKTIVLSNNLFDKAEKYKAIITASYLDYVDYSKTATIEFSINAKETLKPVYTNVDFTNVKKGSKIELISPDNAEIYYTTDGSEPTKDSIKYESPIEINKDITIKAIAMEDKKNSSTISTFDFKLRTKNNYKVYLSPSNQSANLGVREVGFTTEEKEMNDLTNYIEKRLKEHNVTLYRNGYGDINRWTQDSTYLGVDLHLAIHSNASEEHTSYGIETWVHNSDSKMYSLAQNIQKNLLNIYYNNQDKLANRGVKYANGSLAEVNPYYTPVGILIEVAHHDYLLDAKWIMENKETIGNTIADTILEYFQIK